jgi:hypothetical protein
MPPADQQNAALFLRLLKKAQMQGGARWAE